MPRIHASSGGLSGLSTRPQKRKAEEAFTNHGSISQTHMRSINKSRPNKIIHFRDDDDDDDEDDRKSEQNISVKSKSNKIQDGRPPGTDATNHSNNNMGRLKQRAQALLPVRQSLPIHPHASEIQSELQNNDVLLLVGETGSGKSTQIPQFLLSQSYVRPQTTHGSVKIGGRIAITQPRRVAAISLARRVAEELGSTLGNASPASQVGYAVRFDVSVSPATRTKFLTDGMLLQELLRDPWLKEYSVVVVDEVHERGVNVDLVLGFLRRILEAKGKGKEDGRGGVPLKVVVMSATADMERIEKFFGINKEGEGKEETNRVVTNGKKNGMEQNGKNDENESEESSGGEKGASSKIHGSKTNGVKPTKPIRIASIFIKGRQYPVTINYTSQPVISSWDAALERIVQIHQHTPLPGDILVFLPGQEAIDSLESLCISYANDLFQQSKQKGAPKVPKLLILPLFAALSTTAQQRVFEQTPPFTRKIILSTNIAETSVTVPGIRHVIDTGKRKARFFRPSLNLDTLLTKPISRSSAKQRTGRAGREAPGTCWRLYTEKTFYELEADTEPEILRCDLSQLVLTLKAHDIDDVLSFPLLTQPPIKALERALLHLLQLKALDPKTGHITPLGKQMSTLPLPANLARILLASTEPQYNCVDEIVDIVSGLSVENIWLPIHNRTTTQQQSSDDTPNHTRPKPSHLPSSTTNKSNQNEDAEEGEEPTNPIELARRTLYRRSGDHMTLLAAMQAYTSESSDRKAWCVRHGISYRAIRAANDVRKQLTKLMARYRPKHSQPSAVNKDTASSTAPQTSTEPDLEIRVLRALLTGLFTNTARLASHLPSSTTTSSSSNPPGGAPPQSQSLAATPYRTYFTQRPLQIHPSSVLFARERGNQAPDIVFSELVYTARPYARCVSVVEGRWVEEAFGRE